VYKKNGVTCEPKIRERKNREKMFLTRIGPQNKVSVKVANERKIINEIWKKFCQSKFEGRQGGKTKRRARERKARDPARGIQIRAK